MGGGGEIGEGVGKVLGWDFWYGLGIKVRGWRLRRLLREK
jgi:hypothetical protein